MIISIAGDLGSGKSTAAKLLASRLGYNHYSTGDFMREMALAKGVSLMKLSEMAETDNSIDYALDNRQIMLGKAEDNFVIDARLGWHFIPGSFKVFLKVDDEEAARRIFNESKGEGPINRKNEAPMGSQEETLSMIRKRCESENLRYTKIYGIDLKNLSNYDIVIDTTRIPPDKVVDKIRLAIKRVLK